MAYFALSVEASCAAVHALHASGRLLEAPHAHTFQVIATVGGRQLDPAGVLLDFQALRLELERELDNWRGRNIHEEVAEFRPGGYSPSAEQLAYVLYQRLAPRLPPHVHLVRMQVAEAPGCVATYGEERL